MINFSTKRFHIRPLTHVDKQLFCDLYTDKKVMQHVGVTHPRKKVEGCFEQALNYMVEQPAKRRFLVIRQKVDKNEIGLLGLDWNQYTNNEMELGILLKPEYHGRGYASEVFKGLVGFIFDHLSILHLTAKFHATNMAASKLVIGLDFSRQQLGKRAINSMGRTYTLSKRQWRLRHPVSL